MSAKRQKIRHQPASHSGKRGESRKPPVGGIEALTAKRRSESPAKSSEQLMEQVCERNNCLQALKRVKSNKGSAGIDGMTVAQLPVYLKEHWLVRGKSDAKYHTLHLQPAQAQGQRTEERGGATGGTKVPRLQHIEGGKETPHCAKIPAPVQAEDPRTDK